MAITTNIGEPWLFVLVVCAVLLIMGFFLESISMLLIMVPVLHPSLGSMMLDPIWFGVLFVVMIECALISPPVGMNLFVIQAVAKVNLAEVVKGRHDKALAFIGVTQIGRDQQRVTSRRFHFSSRFLRTGLIAAVVNHQFRNSGACQCNGDRSPDSARGAGYDCRRFV